MTFWQQEESELVSTPDAEASAQAQLRGSSYREVRHVSCELRAGVLTLRGRLPNYYLKQIAQNLVWPMEGIVEIDDQLEVVQLRM